MNQLVFFPWIDIPLVVLTTAAFIWRFHHIARTGLPGSAIDVSERVPSARLRVVVLFAGLLVLAWGIDRPVWPLFAISIAGGVMLSGFLPDGSLAGIGGVAVLIEECCLGFPRLALQPPREAETSQNAETKDLAEQPPSDTVFPE